MKLQSQLILSTVTVGVIPALLVGVVGFFLATSALQESSSQLVQKNFELEKYKVADYLQMIELGLDGVASNPFYLESLAAMSGQILAMQEENSFLESQLSDVSIQVREKVLALYEKKYETLPDAATAFLDSLDSQDSVWRSVQLVYGMANGMDAAARRELAVAQDMSIYSITHELVYDGLKKAADRLKMADIQLIDSKSSRIVFSLQKSADLGLQLPEDWIADYSSAENSGSSLSFRKISLEWASGGDRYLSFIVPLKQESSIQGYVKGRVRMATLQKILVNEKSTSLPGLQSYITGSSLIPVFFATL